MYRPDIQALRAIAVIAVVFYHAGVSGFKGGYVGVDIFFVISGFLITKILTNEFENSGKISYLSFYYKRACRLLPALLSTLFVTTIFSSLFFSSYLLSKYGESLVTSTLSIANIYFYTQSEYFDSNAILKPLLHIWSLGVEEQFYLIWPVFIYLVLSQKFSKKFAFTILNIIGLVSLVASQYWLAKDSAASFFLMPFRIFEFSIGAMLCWVKPSNNKLVYYIGILLLAYSIFMFDENTLFPGFHALIPCIGAIFFIWSERKDRSELIYKYLGLLYIGRISYSLYLVHWPVTVFWRYVFANSNRNALDPFCIILISLICGVVSYHFIENRFRKVDNRSVKTLISCLVISIGLIIIGFSQALNNGWAARPWQSAEIIDSITLKKEKELRFSVRQKICSLKGWDNCDDLITDKFNVLVMGDSHAVDALNALDKQFPQFNYALSTLGGCPPSDDISRIAPNGIPEIEECKSLNINRHNYEYLKRFDLIVINIFMDWYMPEHLIKYLSYLHNNGLKNVIIFGNYLSLQQEMPILINRYGYDDQEIAKWVSKNEIIEEKLEQKSNEYGYLFISKKSIFCKTSKCEFFNKTGAPFTYDTNHLSYEFSRDMLDNHKGVISNYLSRNSK